MLTYNEAYKIGRKACIDAIGAELFETHKENAVFGCSKLSGAAFCFVGVSDKPFEGRGLLDSTSTWPYTAQCLVRLEDGGIERMKVERNADN